MDIPQQLATKEDVIALMGGATSEADWNEKCDQVKRAFNGYPDFWYVEIILSGLVGRTAAKWNGDAEIHIERF